MSKGKKKAVIDEANVFAETIKIALLEAFASPALQEIVRQGVAEGVERRMDKWFKEKSNVLRQTPKSN